MVLNSGKQMPLLGLGIAHTHVHRPYTQTHMELRATPKHVRDEIRSSVFQCGKSHAIDNAMCWCNDSWLQGPAVLMTVRWKLP